MLPSVCASTVLDEHCSRSGMALDIVHAMVTVSRSMSAGCTWCCYAEGKTPGKSSNHKILVCGLPACNFVTRAPCGSAASEAQQLTTAPWARCLSQATGHACVIHDCKARRTSASTTGRIGAQCCSAALLRRLRQLASVAGQPTATTSLTKAGMSRAKGQATG